MIPVSKQVFLIFSLEHGHKIPVILDELEAANYMRQWRANEFPRQDAVAQGDRAGPFHPIGNLEQKGPWLIDPKRIIAIQMVDMDVMQAQQQQQMGQVGQLPLGPGRFGPGTSGM